MRDDIGRRHGNHVLLVGVIDRLHVMFAVINKFDRFEWQTEGIWIGRRPQCELIVVPVCPPPKLLRLYYSQTEYWANDL